VPGTKSLNLAVRVQFHLLVLIFQSSETGSPLAFRTSQNRVGVDRRIGFGPVSGLKGMEPRRNGEGRMG
jgi:hypothetical protein